jgi:transposase
MDWSKVIFSDEACIWFGKTGRMYVRRPRGKDYAYQDEYVAKYQHHGEKINIIGFVTVHGVGKIEIFSENMDKIKMKKLLSNNLLQTAQQYFPNEQWYFLHDNDKKFKSGLVEEWCHNNGVTVMDFPPYSPDLNPIENVWAYLKYQVTQRNPKDVDALKTIIVDEWKKIPLTKLGNCITSMPKRCAAVIANNGYKTKY